MKKLLLVLGALTLCFFGTVFLTTILAKQKTIYENQMIKIVDTIPILERGTSEIEEQVESVKNINSLFSLIAWIFVYRTGLGILLILLLVACFILSAFFIIKVFGVKKIGKFEFHSNNIKEIIDHTENDILFLLLEQGRFLQKIIPINSIILHEQLERVERSVDQLLDKLDNNFVNFLQSKKGEQHEIFADRDYFAFTMFKHKIEKWIVNEIKYYLKKNNLLEKKGSEFRTYTNEIYNQINEKIQERIIKSFHFNSFTQAELINLCCGDMGDTLKDTIYFTFQKAKDIKQNYINDMEKDMHTFYGFAKTIYKRQGWNYEKFKESFQIDLESFSSP